ncbi:MAG: hypothetical protein V3V09_08900 [Arenicellales bacterium]
MKKTQFKKAVSVAAMLAMTALVPQSSMALALLLGDAENGEKVLASNCSGCHKNMFGGDGSKIYTRADHKIKTLEGLMQQVDLCNVNTQNGALSADELDDITAHLNEGFYLFDD